MKTSQLGFGIIGTGAIAGVISDAIVGSASAKLVAVCSRRMENALRFTQKRPGVTPLAGIEGLLTNDRIGAVYIATPTVAKEELALAAIGAGKHVLVDKPFACRTSVLRMVEAAWSKGVVFMDATHFVHHPRTALVRGAIAEKTGSPRSLHTAFYYPISDPSNIRFDRNLEPMGAIGDMAWYSMRAVVEYLQPAAIVKVAAVAERDAAGGAVVRTSGLIAFESGEVSTFDAGYTAGTVVMDLQVLGTKGVIGIDDFVLDWGNSFAFKNPDITVGYSFRSGTAPSKDAVFVPTRSERPAEVLMIENFCGLIESKDPAEVSRYADASLKTQEYVDAIWAACPPNL
jgi:predicted dehydrogenase